MGLEAGKLISKTLRSIALGLLLALCYALLSYPSDAERIPLLRMLIPESYGMTCHGNVCAEDASHLNEALSLYIDVKQDLSSGGVSLKYFEPNFLFCVTQECFFRFVAPTEREDFSDTAAVAAPFFGTVIKPHVWNKNTVAHEMIHHIQYEHWMLHAYDMPQWMKEGMAYHHTKHNMEFMSQDIVDLVTHYKEWVGEKSLREALDASTVWFNETSTTEAAH